MGSMVDFMMMLLMLGGGYLAYKEGLFDDLLGSGSGGGGGKGGSGGGGGSPAAGGAATGNCSGGPYKSTGKTVSTSKKGPTTRHYASGKADDKTVEMNAKGIKFQNYQYVVYVTLKSMAHEDTVSLKLGGRHMNGGWWDHGVNTGSGLGCLGTETKHPNTQQCIVKGKSVGSIVGKKVGVAAVCFRSGKTEIWADVGKGWQMLASAPKVNKYPLSGDNEAQLRIDGFKDEPQIHCATVSEISGGGGPAPAPAKAKSAMVIDHKVPTKQLIPVESGIEYY